MSERTGMTVTQVTDEVLYTGLIEMQELDAPRQGQGSSVPHPIKEVGKIEKYVGYSVGYKNKDF